MGTILVCIHYVYLTVLYLLPNYFVFLPNYLHNCMAYAIQLLRSVPYSIYTVNTLLLYCYANYVQYRILRMKSNDIYQVICDTNLCYDPCTLLDKSTGR